MAINFSDIVSLNIFINLHLLLKLFKFILKFKTFLINIFKYIFGFIVNDGTGLIKHRQTYNGVVDAFRSILNSNGIKGLYQVCWVG